jgi:ketopantoate reductase
MLAVKGNHTAAVARQLAPFLADDGFVVAPRNGTDNVRAISAAVVSARERHGVDEPGLRPRVSAIADIEQGSRDFSRENLLAVDFSRASVQ